MFALVISYSSVSYLHEPRGGLPCVVICGLALSSEVLCCHLRPCVVVGCLPLSSRTLLDGKERPLLLVGNVERFPRKYE